MAPDSAQDFRRFMRLAWHELRTPVTVITGYVRMLRKGRPGVVDAVNGGVDAVLAQIEPQIERLNRLLMALVNLSESRSLFGTIAVCETFVPGLRVEASDEARIVAAPLDAFTIHVLTLLLSLPGADSGAFTASAEVLVTPEDCTVLLGSTIPSAMNGLRQLDCPNLTDVPDAVAALQTAGCTVSFYEHSSGTRLIEVRWTRPRTSH